MGFVGPAAVHLAARGRDSGELPAMNCRRGRAASAGGEAEGAGGLEVDHDFMLGRRLNSVDRPVSQRGVAYTRDYCFGGTRVDCQDTNCTPWPRLAHTL